MDKRTSAFGRFLPIEGVRRTSALSCTTFILWLYQRHDLKAFRASVGDVEGHDSFVSDSLFLDTELIDKMIRKCQDLGPI
jgi:hypothetical protein